jgi:Fic family protein
VESVASDGHKGIQKAVQRSFRTRNNEDIRAMLDIPEGYPAPYVPELLLPKNLDLPEFFDDTLKAIEKISRYDGILHNMVNPKLILATLKYHEAVLSSKIEGTIATLEEVLIYDAQPPLPGKEVRNEIKEVYNYTQAMELAVTELTKNRFVRTLYAISITLFLMV